MLQHQKQTSLFWTMTNNIRWTIIIIIIILIYLSIHPSIHPSIHSLQGVSLIQMSDSNGKLCDGSKNHISMQKQCIAPEKLCVCSLKHWNIFFLRPYISITKDLHYAEQQQIICKLLFSFFFSDRYKWIYIFHYK